MLTTRIVLFSILNVLATTARAEIVVTLITPPTGPSSGGTTVVLTGSGFFGGCARAPCAPAQVTFDGVPAQSVRVESDTRMTAVTPPVNPFGGLRYGTYSYPPVSDVVVQIGNQRTLAYFGRFSYSDLIPVPDLSKLQRILLPSYTCDLPGAHGSVWCAEFSVFNASADAITVYPVYPYIGEISAFSMPPNRFAIPRLIESDNSFLVIPPRSARVLYVDPAHADDLRFNLRIYDQSRTRMTWGTEVPVVRERDLRSAQIEIFPVPLNGHFRQALRIYDPFRLGTGEVEARFFAARTGELIATRTVTLAVYERSMSFGGIDQSFPGLAEFNNLMIDVPELAAVPSTEQLRIEVVPVTPGLRFWAMVSLTNNETQHVTLLTPQ